MKPGAIFTTTYLTYIILAVEEDLLLCLVYSGTLASWVVDYGRMTSFNYSRKQGWLKPVGES